MTKVAQADIHIRGKDKTKTAFNSVQGRLMRLKNGLTGLHGAMGLVMGAGFVAMGKEALKSADSIGKFADRAGVTTAELQKMRYAFNLAGVGVEAVDKALLTFGKRLGKSRQGIGALEGGLKGGEEALLRKLKATRDTSEALNVMFRAMGEAETQTRKLAIADAGFGMAGLRMTAGFREGSEAFFEAKQEAERLGIVIDEKLIRKAEALNDQMAKSAEIIKSKFIVAFMMLEPWLRKTADGFIDLMQFLTGAMNFSGFERNALEEMLKNWQERLEDLTKQFESIPDLPFWGKDIAGWVYFNKQIEEATDIVDSLREAIEKLPDATIAMNKAFGGGGFNQLRSTGLPGTKSATRIPLVGDEPVPFGPQLQEGSYQKMIDLSEHRFRAWMKEKDALLTINRVRLRGNEGLAREIELIGEAEKIKGRGLHFKEIEEIEKTVQAQMRFNKQLEIQNNIVSASERIFDRAGDGLISAMQRGESAMESFKNVALAVLFDVQREMIKLMVFAPLKKQLFDFAGGFFDFGGGRATGGPVQAGKTFLVGEKGPELFSPSTNGNITPNHQLGGGVNVTLNFSTGVQSTVRAEVMGLMPVIAENVKHAVSEARLRGGSFSQAMGV